MVSISRRDLTFIHSGLEGSSRDASAALLPIVILRTRSTRSFFLRSGFIDAALIYVFDIYSRIGY